MKILINGTEVDLSSAVIDITLAAAVIVPVDPPAPVDPPVIVDPPAPPPASKVIASCQVVVAGTSVTFTDKTASALPITSVLIGPGLGGSNKEIGAGGSLTLTYPAGKFNAAITATDNTGAKSVKLFAITVPGDSDNTYSASDPSTGTAPPVAPPVVGTNPPVVAPASTGSQTNATHTVAVAVVDATGATWSATAKVGEDWTVDGVYLSLSNAGAPHPGIRARVYSDCVDVGTCPGSNAGDYAGTLSVTYDGATVFGPEAVQLERGRMNKTIRYGKQAPWHPVDMSIFPNWATPAAPLPIVDLSKYDLSYNGLGVATSQGMGDPGSRWDIGFVPGWDVPFCLQPSDAAFAVVRAAADNSGVWAIYFIDDNTGLPYDVRDYPNTSMLTYTQAVYANNPIVKYPTAWAVTKNKYPSWSQAHQTAYNFVAAAATGTARDKWHCAVHANAGIISFNATQRQAEGVFGGYQERGTAWALRSIFLASQVSSMPDYFANQLDIMRKLAPQNNSLGFLADHLRPGANDVAKGPPTGIANWEENYGRMTVGVIANKLPEWSDFRAYWSKSLVMQTSSVQYPISTIYVLTIRDAVGNFLPDWAAIMQATLRGPQGIPVPPKMTPPNDQGAWDAADIAAFTAPDVTSETVYALIAKYTPGYVAGDFLSYPAASQGYAAIQSGALAAAVDAGVPGAAQAWANWQNVPTKVDWSDDWGFNIVPRDTVS